MQFVQFVLWSLVDALDCILAGLLRDADWRAERVHVAHEDCMALGDVYEYVRVCGMRDG